MIRVTLDMMLLKRRMTSAKLVKEIGLTPANVSILKTGKGRAIRFSTLDKICKALKCQPGDLLAYEEDDADAE